MHVSTQTIDYISAVTKPCLQRVISVMRRRRARAPATRGARKEARRGMLLLARRLVSSSGPLAHLAARPRALFAVSAGAGALANYSRPPACMPDPPPPGEQLPGEVATDQDETEFLPVPSGAAGQPDGAAAGETSDVAGPANTEMADEAEFVAGF